MSMFANNQTLAQMRSAKVAVVGLGVTGVSVLNFLLSQNIKPDLFDSRGGLPEAVLSKPELKDLNVKLGAFSDNEFKGYDFVIVSPGISLSTPALVQARQEIDNVFCDVELFARVNQKPVVAVTGSNGKSTVVAWLEDFLNRVGKKAVACGNYGVPVLDVVRQDYDVFILELSSFQLESTTSLVCEAATVLNVTEDHMDRYDSFEHYSRAKNKIYQRAKLCLYNHDDFQTKPLISHHKVESFGALAACFEQTCWHYEPDTQSLKRNQDILANLKDCKVTGQHNGLNALAVLALASSLGVDIKAEAKHLEGFAGLPHRCQFVAETDGVTYINDSKATNIASTQAALSGLASGKNVILLAGGDAKGGDLSELAPAISAAVKKVIAFGRDAAQFSDFLQEQQLIRVSTLEEAVAQAKALSQSGDLVLLSPACASIDMFANYQQRGERFVQTVKRLSHSTGEQEKT